jgi:hypothetical protein
LITTLKLGTTQGSGAHQMQASWACGLKGVDRFKKAHGAYVTKVKQDCKRLTKTHSFQGAKIWKKNVQGKSVWTKIQLQKTFGLPQGN